MTRRSLAREARPGRRFWSLFPSLFRRAGAEAENSQNSAKADDRYAIKASRTLAHRAVALLPEHWREKGAEALLRRRAAPGPAAEHAFQYLLSVEDRRRESSPRLDAVVAKGADNFYERQYRQYLNPVMGAFAMTATRALAASAAAARGPLWARRRASCAVMLDEATIGAPPILVIDEATVAIPLLAPKPCSDAETAAAAQWLTGRGPMPPFWLELIEGRQIACAETGVIARERSADAAALELIHAVTQSRKLALLALSPGNPDAMGLHITLFGVETLPPRFLAKDYGLDALALTPWREAAAARGRMLLFCVGGTEEAFTQCSQNLFVKRSLPQGEVAALSSWSPQDPLERLIEHQFELFQITVSASGLPGVSPRNGLRGKAGFVMRLGAETYVLVPYRSGNAIHGHAAKLWTNGHGALMAFDDVETLVAVTLSGPCRILSHEAATRRFAGLAQKAEGLTRRDGSPAPEPEYWFEQRIAKISCLDRPLAPHALDPARPTCTINAGGLALHGKKPAYFAAEGMPRYDQKLQHEREAAGRPVDPSGARARRWRETLSEAAAKDYSGA